MECYSEQSIAIFVDGELEMEEARRLRDHLATCRRCRQLLDALRAESRSLSESLQELPDEAASLADFSRAPRSWGWGDVAVVAAVLALGSMIGIWIDQLSVPEGLQWLNPLSVSGRTNLVVDLSYYFAHGGAAMLADYAAVLGKILLLLLLGGSALLLGRLWRLREPGLRLLVALLVLSLPGFALEVRHSEFVTIPANQTIDDTLVVSGNIVGVDGVINGDLLAFGRTVEVRGTVKGDLVSFAERTMVSGTVEGNIYNFSNTLDLEGQLSHSVYGLMHFLHVSDRAQVGNGVVVAASDVTLEGQVKRSVTMFASNAVVSGSIGRELTTSGGSLTVTNTARIGGNLSARVRQLKKVFIADGATIAGARDIQVRRQSHFSRPRFYFHQAIWLAAAVLVGWLLLVLFPAFFQASTQALSAGWRSLGLGFAVLVGVPVAIVLTAVTLVGLPLSFMLLAVYLIAIYLAKIWVGAFLGRMLLKPASPTKGDWLLSLLVGLLIITVVRFIPYLGGLVHFGVICLGLGALAWQLYRLTRPVIAT